MTLGQVGNYTTQASLRDVNRAGHTLPKRADCDKIDRLRVGLTAETQ